MWLKQALEVRSGSRTEVGREGLGMEALSSPAGYLCYNQPFSFVKTGLRIVFVCVCVCPQGPEVLGPLDLELQVIMSH